MSAANSILQGVREELAGQGTTVLAVMPSEIDTDLSCNLPPPKMPPAEVAEQTLDALEAGEEVLYPGDMVTGVSQGLNADAKAVENEFAQYLPMSANE